MQNLKLFVATILLSLGLVVGVAVFLSQTTSPTGTAAEQTTSPQQIVEGARHFRGATEEQKPPFVLVEFSDLQCPACAAVHPRVKALLEKYPEKVQLVYRHYPLQTIHPNALPAARAAEAAAAQGKFWEMHDELFATQSQWERLGSPDEFFVGVAEKLQLNKDEFLKVYQSEEARSVVLDDVRLGEQLRVNSTPTFYLNGELLDLSEVERRIAGSTQ